MFGRIAAATASVSVESTKVDRDTEAGQHAFDEVLGAAVQRPGGNDMVARSEVCGERRVDGGHAAGKAVGGLGAFDLRHRAGQGIGGRIVDARVGVAGLAVAQDVAQLLSTVGTEGDGLVDRHRVRLLGDARRPGRGRDGPRAEAGGGAERL